MFKMLLCALWLGMMQVANADEIALWPKQMPDDSGVRGVEQVSDKGSVTAVSRPRLIVHQPAHPNGVAILLISGGGYAHIELGKESTPTAKWLQSQGVTAFELVYRLPTEGWSSVNVPFQDAQRAMKIVRSQADVLGFDAHKIGIIGFSAGAHLAGFTAALPEQSLYASTDPIDALSARPDFVGLIYPVLTMLPPFNQTHAHKSILGQNPSPAQETAFSIERQITAQMPPTFLAHSQNDTVSRVDNSLLMFAALRQSHIPAELHVFQTGGHGWGMGKKGSGTQAWSGLFAAWAQQNGFWQTIK